MNKCQNPICGHEKHMHNWNKDDGYFCDIDSIKGMNCKCKKFVRG